MGKDTKRAYKVVPVDEDEPDFGDPPRNWGRVASMAGVWAVVLLGSAWMAPGFASGGGDEDLPASEQPPTTPRQAAARYLEAGLDGESDRADEVLCDDASPEVLVSDLVKLSDEYGDRLKNYPEIEVSTSEPVVSDSGMEVAVQVSFIGDSIFYEDFTVTVLAVGDSYCVADAIQNAEDDPSEQTGELDLDFLRFIVWDRDTDAATEIQCPEYSGPTPRELLTAVEAWESEHGAEGTSYAAPTGAEAHATPNAVTQFPYEVVMNGDGFEETFEFNVTISDECVLDVSGGETLLAYSQG